MKARVIYNSVVPKISKLAGINATAITIVCWIFVRGGNASLRLLNHEKIHVAQYSELWVIGFPVIYVWDWLKGLIYHRNLRHAYRSIRLEQEARAGQSSLDYLATRKRFAWRKFKVFSPPS